MPPSYHLMTISGRSAFAAKRNVTIDANGAVSFLISGGAFQWVEQASTLSGQPSFKALNAADKLWHPMSPSTPVPKSHQPRQANGW